MSEEKPMFHEFHFPDDVTNGVRNIYVCEADQITPIGRDECSSESYIDIFNLLEDTLRHMPDWINPDEDILFCSYFNDSGGCWFTWEEFKELADKDVDWEDEYNVDGSLEIVGKNWYMSRMICPDEQVRWHFHQLPKKPATKPKPESLYE